MLPGHGLHVTQSQGTQSTLDPGFCFQHSKQIYESDKKKPKHLPNGCKKMMVHKKKTHKELSGLFPYKGQHMLEDAIAAHAQQFFPLGYDHVSSNREAFYCSLCMTPVSSLVNT